MRKRLANIFEKIEVYVFDWIKSKIHFILEILLLNVIIFTCQLNTITTNKVTNSLIKEKNCREALISPKKILPLEKQEFERSGNQLIRFVDFSSQCRLSKIPPILFIRKSYSK